MKTARVQIVPTRRTDLLCMSCGRFRTEYAVVPVGGDTTREATDSHVGVHRGCLANVHLRRGALRTRTSPLDRSIDVTPDGE